MKQLRDRLEHFSTFQVILAGFAIVILIGSFLLCLPVSSIEHVWTPYIDSLFTSTSAVCVTGLIVHDTATYWSLFGRIVILCLIQIGGLGVVTIAVTLAIMSGRRIGLMQRSLMQSSISAPSIGGIVRLTKFIVRSTLGIELIGAAIMSPVFIRDFGTWRGIGYAVFHSVSAFCNAGFDLMGVRQPYSSLTSYSDNSVICITIMALIIVGGLGFLTWSDIVHNGIHFRRMHLQTKVILVTTLCLILFPFLYFFFVEYKGASGMHRVLLALFQSVTPRTAGFNTADYSKMSDTGLMITTILMLIGGAPGSTAGGMKVTTAAVLLVFVAGALRRHDQVTMFKRGIDISVIHDAAALCGTYILLFLVGSMILSATENIPIMKCMFECASALGTVGLTTGITPTLHVWSHLILIGFMYFGRVGALTMAYATVTRKPKKKGTLPCERLMVG
ncbi:MAG: potassium transporter TrkG [Lactimicrobium sp.]|jgi:trk system potassium uptake protein TrkH|uniref:TrkH family potassium uptake protein n=1 Tax=Lactimicrobium sp. TaxID=2563780 RepID=UPI002F35049D